MIKGLAWMEQDKGTAIHYWWAGLGGRMGWYKMARKGYFEEVATEQISG